MKDKIKKNSILSAIIVIVVASVCWIAFAVVTHDLATIKESPVTESENITASIDEKEEIDSKYSASNARDISNESIQEKYEELMALDVPEYFTYEERQFFYHITTICVKWDARFGKFESEVTMHYDYAVWTENLVKYLKELGYKVDTETNIVSW